jgi:hypothetical protein
MQSENALGSDTPKANIQELYEMCKESTGSPPQTFCLGYIGGVGEFMQLNGSIKSSLSDAQWSAIANLAIRDHPTYGAMVQAFMNWAAEHPEKWGMGRAAATVIALRDAWPCH